MSIEMNRRTFVTTAAAGIFAAGAAAGVTGCSNSSGSDSTASDGAETEESSQAPVEIAETVECDIVIVGGGITGLAAAVQAGENGSNTILVERGDDVGGNGQGVEGTFAINSSLQKEQGIELELKDIIRSELEGSQWRSDGLLWKDFIMASADNFAWLVDNGVQFSGVVESYGTPHGAPTFHWFEGGKGSIAYVPAMSARADELGVTKMLKTVAKDLISEDGVVKGVYVENADGEVIAIQSKAVILASGGFADDNELVSKIGYKEDNLIQIGVPGNEGFGYKSAMKLGAWDTLKWATFNTNNIILALPHEVPIDPINGCVGMGQGGPFLWINQDGERFVDENLAAANFELQTVPHWNHKMTYTVFDSKIFADWTVSKDIETAEAVDILNASLETNEGDSFWSGETIEEVAEKAGLPVEAVKATVDYYNESCDLGSDRDFGKDVAMMQKIATPPFYIGRITAEILMTVGGIGTNRKFEVVTEDGDPIPGLYAIGTDGNMLYRNIYTIDVPGSCSASGIHGGRVAANEAKKYYEG